jgi:hypothetical protein
MKEDLRIMEINSWTKCNQDRVKWKKVVHQAKNSNNEFVAPDEEEEYQQSKLLKRKLHVLSCLF